MLEYLRNLINPSEKTNNITIIININNLDKDLPALQDLITFIRETAEKENTKINIDIKTW